MAAVVRNISRISKSILERVLKIHRESVQTVVERYLERVVKRVVEKHVDRVVERVDERVFGRDA